MYIRMDGAGCVGGKNRDRTCVCERERVFGTAAHVVADPPRPMTTTTRPLLQPQQQKQQQQEPQPQQEEEEQPEQEQPQQEQQQPPAAEAAESWEDDIPDDWEAGVTVDAIAVRCFFVLIWSACREFGDWGQPIILQRNKT